MAAPIAVGMFVQTMHCLSVVTVWFQLALSFTLVRWQIRRRLRFEPAPVLSDPL